jgi:SPP1 gp7 family putative phage head morphogenesis protein
MADRVEDEMIRHTVGLRRFDQTVINKILKHLEKVQADITRQIAATIPGVTMAPETLSPSAQENLRRLRIVIDDLMAEAHKALRSDLKGDMIALANYEAQYMVELVSRSASLGVALEYPGRELLRSIVTQKPFQGRILSDWAQKMERNQVERIWQNMQIGLTERESTDQIIKRLRGTGALKFRDGQFAKDQRGAEALVRTASNHVYNQARVAVAQNNPDKLPRYRWSSILDMRTTPLCRSRAGQIYNTGEGPLPPAHWNCRSSVVYLRTASSAEDEPRFDQWLERQDEAVQIETLGPNRHKLWKGGGLSVRKFTDHSGKPLTLEQLRSRDLQAWERAGLK